MAERKGLTSLLAVGFLLNGVVPFSLFIAVGLVYSVGSSLEIIALIAALVVGGFGFSALGLSLSDSGKLAGVLLLSVALATAIVTDLLLLFFRVLPIWLFAILVLMNMSSNSPVSYGVSRFVRSTRGKALSISSTLTIGVGAPVIFPLLFFIYVYIGYSHLPLIALCSEVFAFVVSFALIGLSVRFTNIKKEVLH